jgi:tetratricopeptide (TPR) repeat protein
LEVNIDTYFKSNMVGNPTMMIKTLLIFALVATMSISNVCGLQVPAVTAATAGAAGATHNEWIENSLSYYKRITRGSAAARDVFDKDPRYLATAMQSYFARQKIKEGKVHHAETIYRRLMEEMSSSSSSSTRQQQQHHHYAAEKEDECCISSCAIPTLLLGLLLQREGRYEETRMVFESFLFLLQRERQHYNSSKKAKCHHPVRCCCCCARVLQAFALFEMKQGNPPKAVKLMQQAIRIDRTLRPVLRWKQFQDAMSVTYEQQQQPKQRNGKEFAI